MAPRANWKGFLRLSFVTCPVALYPATFDSEKISSNQLNRKTGHRIKYTKVMCRSAATEIPERNYKRNRRRCYRNRNATIDPQKDPGPRKSVVYGN
jgi:non-homologous end joining protein Ku